MGALVSLVMSDIVESTRRWAADEAAMAVDLELHDRLLRGALEGAGGTVCKHTGDGMLATFDDPAAAVDAAGAAQSYANGAWWIDLSAATSEDVVLPVAMTAVDAREIPGRTRLQAFTDRFAAAAGLIVFDNCEHVLPAARSLVEALRQFAEDRLVEADSIGEIHERHLAWTSALAAASNRATELATAPAAFTRFGAELDNMRVAIAFAMETGRQEAACGIVARINRLAFLRPAWEVFDWVRPLSLDAGSSIAAILCELRGGQAQSPNS